MSVCGGKIQFLLAGLLVATLVVSVSRTGALLRNYSAPMAVFGSLPQADFPACVMRCCLGTFF